MRRIVQATTLAAVALVVPQAGLVAPAEAGGFWTVGGSFSVGGLDFAVVYDRPVGYYRPYAPATYYRVHRPLRYPGYSCHSSCSYRAGAYYHHADCPLVHHHFRQHRYTPARAWVGAFPVEHGYRYFDRRYPPPRHYNEYRGYGHHKHRGHGHYKHCSKSHKKHYRHDCCRRGGRHRGW